ncbi:Cof-type HAD-IIB family hydrolase [Steroidobacter sp. S1-65]|uniref:Cof-type HAD-IIB family hydrolase n=1 Tax=Steroidobacter gossypii TaxID=2805490 RepID=A0ABS1X2A3_9GAMM|nr:Cof-type HAD-IIB family hydrolase [Steroidobacter gossypii]MBM0107343.1 Cof-type HAD-IIB family hydrolase [Steroidobacter gossypii]
MIALIGIDVDGTLVGHSGEVPDIVWKTAEQARAAGIHLALCSGRPAFGVAAEYARRLDDDGWHIFQNGASIVNLATRESRSTPLPEGCVRGLISQARETEQVLELYGDDDYAVESEAPWASQHADLLGLPFKPRPFETLLPPLVRGQWLLSPEDAERIEAPPDLEMAQSTSPLMPNVRFVGLTRKGVSKGSAMREIAAAYRIDMRDVMYIGDSGNDISALRVVGHPIAMGNADPEVIQAAGRTVGHVDEAGVAEALRIALASR